MYLDFSSVENLESILDSKKKNKNIFFKKCVIISFLKAFMYVRNTAYHCVCKVQVAGPLI